MVLKKSQRVGSFLLSLVMLLALTSVFCFEKAYAASDGEWSFELDALGANITGYIGTDKSVTVPAKLGGKTVYKVSALSTNYFKSSITSITFSNGITQLGDAVCKGYTSLNKVILPDTLVSIGKDAFASCTALVAITLPTSVSEIGTNAFGGCSSLTSASLNCRVTSIPANLFSGDKFLNTLELPVYLSEIGDSAFENCASLVSVSLPNTVKTIGKSAFSGCTSMNSISLSNELKTIGQLAFYNCKSLKNVIIPNKTKTIGEEAFSNCTSLVNIYISPSVNIIKNNVFDFCTSLEKVVFGGEYNAFNLLSSASTGMTIYYPSKYAESWTDYNGLKSKSYKAPSDFYVTGGKNIAPGAKINLKIELVPSDCEFADILFFSSSDPTVATVSGDGTVIARAIGSTTITITTISGVSKDVTISVMPVAPSNIKVTPKTTSSVDIKWDPVLKATGYNIYRSTSKTGTYKKIGTTTSSTYTDKGLTKGKTYYYKVTSYVNSNGKQVLSDYSTAKSIQVTAPAPATVKAVKTKAGVAKITWAKSTGATGYEVYMAKSVSGSYSKIATISKASTLSYTKTGLTKGKTFYFKVRSYTTVNGKKIYSDFTKVVKVKV